MTTAPHRIASGWRLPRWASSFGFQIIAALILGLVLGLLARSLGASKSSPNGLSSTLATLGSNYVYLLQAAVVPLVFTAVVSGQQRFIDEVKPDFLKIMSDGFFGHPSMCEKTIRTADDLARIKSVGPDHEWITRQVAYVREICDYAGDGL